jgi:hypothetical protein
MGWLFIDTHRLGEVRVGWIEGSYVRLRTRPGRSHGLLPLIQPWTKRYGLPEGIGVVEGPGTFSSIRVGVLVANLLARCWQKPLVAFSVEEGMDPTTFTSRFEQKSARPVSYVAPLYDTEPNITVKRGEAGGGRKGYDG